MESMVLAGKDMLGQQAHEGNTSLVPVLRHSLPCPQACRLQHCCPAIVAALQQLSMALLDLQPQGKNENKRSL